MGLKDRLNGILDNVIAGVILSLLTALSAAVLVIWKSGGRAFLQAMDREEWFLVIGLFLAIVLGGLMIVRWHQQRLAALRTSMPHDPPMIVSAAALASEAAKPSTIPAAPGSVSSATESSARPPTAPASAANSASDPFPAGVVQPDRDYNVVDLGSWVPQLKAVENDGLHWITTMPHIPEWAIGQSYMPSVEDIGVREPPLCPKCTTEVITRRDSIGRVWVQRCPECGFEQSTVKALPLQRMEAEAKARSRYRKLLDSLPRY